jgi:LysM repeat protein
MTPEEKAAMQDRANGKGIYDFLSDVGDGVKSLGGLFTGEPAQQFALGLANKVVDVPVQTEKDFDPSIVEVLKQTAINSGSTKIQDNGIVEGGFGYKDYPDFSDGETLYNLIFNKNSTNPLGRVNDPIAQAGLSIGGGSLKVEGNKVYVLDKYNFGKSSVIRDDSYGTLRKGAGTIIPQTKDESSGHSIKIYIGTKDEILGQEVKKGDSLSKIAKKMKVPVDVLAEYNGITDPSKIQVGQAIRKPSIVPKKEEEEEKDSLQVAIAEFLNTSGIPSLEDLEQKTYIIQKGDTLSEIAQRNNTTVAELVDKNNITNPDMIYAGDTLVV